jgi:methyltransferase OMS1
MARVCKPDGVILLLEHGRAAYQFLNQILDENASKHFERWGCWWNRDIDELIERSNLEVVYRQRWHFGTTYYLICKPKNK